MRILLLSDTHYFNEILEDILDYNKEYFDLKIHCGDSSLPKDHELMKQFNIVVLGNHDDYDYPVYKKYKNILITHGHIQEVYKSYNSLVQLCKEQNCNICFHGHTHIPTHQIIDGITFINPGSTMMNRGLYGYGTYAIVDLNEDIKVSYYHHITHELADNFILEQGLELLKEFEVLLNKK